MTARVYWIILLLALPSIAAAQQGLLTGRVLDSTNAVLPGVTVEAKTHTTVTGADGSYALQVPAGTYDVSFHLLNFASVVRREVTVGAGATARVDTTLNLSSSADVVVTAKQTLRNIADLDEPVNDLIGIADAASVGVITGKEIDRRPFQRAGEILETVPGVIVSQHSGEGRPISTTFAASTSITERTSP